MQRIEWPEDTRLRRKGQAECRKRLRKRASPPTRHINQAVGILLAGLALAVGLILEFG